MGIRVGVRGAHADDTSPGGGHSIHVHVHANAQARLGRRLTRTILQEGRALAQENGAALEVVQNIREVGGIVPASFSATGVVWSSLSVCESWSPPFHRGGLVWSGLCALWPSVGSSRIRVLCCRVSGCVCASLWARSRLTTNPVPNRSPPPSPQGQILRGRGQGGGALRGEARSHAQTLRGYTFTHMHACIPSSLVCARTAC